MKSVNAVGCCTTRNCRVGFQFGEVNNGRGVEYYASGSYILHQNGAGMRDAGELNGSFLYGQGFAGCRACGNKYIYQCGNCMSFNCYDGAEHDALVCPNCGQPSHVAATPVGEKRIVRSSRSAHVQIILAIDASRSMGDPIGGGQTRLGAMQNAAINEFVRAFGDVEIAVVAFATKARTVIGLTRNKTAVENAINSLTVGGGTSSPLAHIRREFPEFLQNTPGYNRYLVVFTDGSWGGQIPGHIAAAGKMRESGLTILTMGCSGADQNFLQSIATQGASIRVADNNMEDAFVTAVRIITQ